MRQVATKEDRLALQLAILTKYQTNEFRELFKENKAIDLVEYEDQDYKIVFEDKAKLSLREMYPISPKHNDKLQDYLQKNLKKGLIRLGHSSIATLILYIKKLNRKQQLYINY